MKADTKSLFFVLMIIGAASCKSDEEIEKCLAERNVFAYITSCMSKAVGNFEIFNNPQEFQKFLERNVAMLCGSKSENKVAQCLEHAREMMKPCLDERTEKLVGYVVDMDEAMQKYICKDNGKRIIELLLDSNNIKCFSKVQNIEPCIELLIPYTNIDSMLTEGQCKALDQTRHCASQKVREACEKPDLINYINEGVKTMLLATPCKNYLTGASTTVAHSFWTLLTIFTTAAYTKLF